MKKFIFFEFIKYRNRKLINLFFLVIFHLIFTNVVLSQTVSCPEDVILNGCERQSDIDSQFATWYSNFNASGGTIRVTDELGNGVDLLDPISGPSLCGGAYKVSISEVIQDKTGKAFVFCSATFSVVGDKTIPVIDDILDYALEGCNPVWPSVVTTSWSDNCDMGGTINGVEGDVLISQDGCTQYRDYTFNVTDSCLNNALPQVTRVSRHYDIIAPTIVCPSNIEIDNCSIMPTLTIPKAIDNCQSNVEVIATRSDGLALNDPYPVGQSITVTYTATDDCQNSTSCNFVVRVNPCNEGGSHCSYTQGYYGNVNGSACLPDGGKSNAQTIMINVIKAQPDQIFNFGSTVTGNYFTLKLSDINGNPTPSLNNIFKMLPGGGKPRGLVGFATYSVPSTWSDNDPLNASKSKKGAINNNLLSQTMTLFFNKFMDATLGELQLEERFTTVDVACGTTEQVPDSNQEFTIPSSIISYLNVNYPQGGATVNNLFNLANKALGGENIGGLTPSNINDAVDAINRGFDECRLKVSSQGGGGTITSTSSTSFLRVINEPIFSVFPVPFKDDLTIKYQFDYKADVKIQILDTKGVILMSVDDSNAYLNKEVVLTPKFKRGEGQIFFLKIITDKGVSVERIISSEKTK
jgi:hypothetical protein